MLKVHRIAFLCVVMLVARSSAWGAAYYVNDGGTTGDVYCSAAGDDRNSGTLPDAPKATVQSVLSAHKLKPGDRVYVDTGRYKLDARIHIRLSGEAKKYIRFIGSTHPTGTTLVRSGTRPPKLYNCLFCVEASRYVSIRNFICAGGHASIIVCRGSRNIVIRDNIIRKGDRADAGIALMGDVDESLVANNVVYDRSTGIQVTSTDPYAGRFAGLCESNWIVNNVIFQCARGITTQGSPGTHILKNSIQACGRVGIGIGSADRPSPKCLLRGNTVYARGNGNLAIRVIPKSDTGLVSDRNTFFLSDGAAVGEWNGSVHKTLDDWRLASGQDRRSINPKLPFGISGKIEGRCPPPARRTAGPSAGSRALRHRAGECRRTGDRPSSCFAVLRQAGKPQASRSTRTNGHVVS